MSGMRPPPCYVAEVAAVPVAVALARAPARTPRDPALTGGGAESAGSTGVDLAALLAVARGALAGGGNPGGERCDGPRRALQWQWLWPRLVSF